MDWIKSILEAVLGSNFAWGVVIVLILAKVLPNTTLQKFFNGLGTACTLFLSKKWSGWKKVEVWLIDGLAVSVTAFIEGLRSDN